MLSLVCYGNQNFKALPNYKMKSLGDLIPSKSVIVHMTDYLPVDGVILSTKNSYKDKFGFRKLRNTVHFAFNQAVPPNKLGLEWDKKSIGIIAPFDKILERNSKSNILGGQPQDFYIKEKVNLPEGTVIVRYSDKIPKGKLKLINAEKIDSFKNTKGIKLVETSDNVRNVTNDYIEKMGYTRLDKLFVQEAKLPNEFIDMDFEKRRDNQSYHNYLFNSKDIKNILKANSELESAWLKMSNQVGFNIYKNHQSSPYGRSEFLVESINILAKHKNKWISSLKTFNVFTQKDEYTQIDYKKDFVNVIDNINKNLRPNEKLSFDINKFKENIITSQTPKEALQKLAFEQGIKPMEENINNINSSISEEQIYKTIDNLVDIFSVFNKEVFQ